MAIDINKKEFWTLAHSGEIAEPPALNHWEMYLKHWCPAQMFYYFQDSDGGK